MGLHLILATTDGYWLSWGLMILNILKVVIALGLVIFVHELGHFLVAKWAGVKCEKFYLGFDIFGLKLWKHQWGETEYGIGVLPLGGYVKMLGQEDNPSRLREEIERAKAQQTAGGGDAPANPDAAASLAEAERALYDPRSYLAQSVPKRMAIISAGVIMNILFAIVTAIAAYGLGVAWVRPEIGDLFPGRAAWRAGLQVGDTIESIKGKPLHRFNGLQKAISVGDIEGGVEMVIQPPRRERAADRACHPRPAPHGANDRNRRPPEHHLARSTADGRPRFGGRPGDPGGWRATTRSWRSMASRSRNTARSSANWPCIQTSR